ncbi:replicative DNA helicase [Desulforhopalus vacuolatus]|uniref:replicative DNA helicase n=1 Tax=Desulforhopalus vacuolatus TaxID=40414 RepID=UPI001966C4F2|nr:replicative DNA helicase [Desulforhopalus vacuolatus]MBM9519041.1 replicative DNA helicase [Desulforhopalus vacuolatus]
MTDSQNPEATFQGRIPPQNIEAEMAVLGSILIQEDLLHRVIDKLRAEDFFRKDHALIYESILELFNKNLPCDLVNVKNHLASSNQLERAGGASYLSMLTTVVPLTSNIASYALIIREKSILRHLIRANTDIATRCYEAQHDIDLLLDDAEQAIFDIADNKSSQGFTAAKHIVPGVFDAITALSKNNESITGVPTGYFQLDKMTSGLQPSDLIIVAARPSMGKTSFAMNIAEHAALTEGVGVAVFSLEMSKEQLVTRMLSSVGHIDSQRIRKGNLQKSDWPDLTRAVASLSEAPIYIDDTPALSVLEMRAKIRRLASQYKIGLVVVDYLQLMQGRSTENRTQEISEISRSLKALAKEYAVPVVALSQLNRSLESRTDKRPMMSDLRESGAIEQDADVILFIYRDEVYNKTDDNPNRGLAEIIIGKQRNGPTGISTLAFVKECTRFENYSNLDVPEELEEE